jgi:AsmA family protein
MRVPRKAWILVGLAGAIAAAIALFEWNMLRGPLAEYIEAKVDRPVTIDGNLHVDLSRQPVITADSVTLGNVPGSAERTMARAQRVAVRVDLASLWHGAAVFPEVTLVQPQVVLERGADGRANWELAPAGDLGAVPRIDRLSIEDGTVRFRHLETGTDVTVKVASSSAPGNGKTPVQFSGSGRLRNRPFTIEGSAASLLALENQDRPYALDVSVRAGGTSAHFDGTIVPARIDNVDGSLTLQGRDLSELYPIIPVPLPWTPPYRLSGRLQHGTHVWTFDRFAGKVGKSDVAGNFALDQSAQPPRIDADVVSRSLDYKDLGGAVGLPPPNAPPSARTVAQNEEAAKRERSGRVLPTKPYDLERLRAVDAKVRFKGKRFIASNLPLDDMSTTLELQGGVLKFQPLDFGVAGGHVVSTLALDARGNVIKTSGDVAARDVDLKQILPAIKPPNGSAGKVGGRARFSASGNSVADMLASSSGEVALSSEGGEASALAIVLTNLDLARAVPLLLHGDASSPIRCVVADFEAENGKLAARTLVMDTDAEKILGEGSVDFANERYDLKLNAHSKKASMIALRGPILVDGSFKSPNVHPAGGPIAARVGTSVALGIVATPFAALVPLVDIGGATDADCSALMQQAQANVAARAMG